MVVACIAAAEDLLVDTFQKFFPSMDPLKRVTEKPWLCIRQDFGRSLTRAIPSKSSHDDRWV